MVLLLSLILSAQVVQVGDRVPAFSLADQYGALHSLKPGARWLVLAFDKRTGGLARQWLKAHREQVADDVVFVLDTSKARDGARNKLILPSLRKFRQPVLVVADPLFQAAYPQQEHCLTALALDAEGVVRAIHFPGSVEAISALVQP